MVMVQIDDSPLSQEGYESLEDAAVLEKKDGENQAAVLLSIEELIKSNVAALDKLSTELKQLRNMFEDSFNNDPVYREHAELAKEAAKVKNATRQQIIKQPSIAAMNEKIKGLRAEMKERQMSLSEYLAEYYRMTGNNEVEGQDGEVREIVNEFRLVKKLQKK